MVTFRKPRTAPQDGTLAVWANGERVGTWSVEGDAHTFQYDDAWPASPAGRQLSLSMPFTPGNLPHRGATVHNFFDNLLPDSDTIRKRLQAKFTTGTAAAFDLLAAIGRDCVGSVQLLPPGAAPAGFDRIDFKPLSDAEVEQAINNTVTNTRLPGQENDDDFRVSIAGAQEKTALLWNKGRWCRPLGATPTTHILKLPLGLVGTIGADMSSSVENEWLCATILRELDFPVANCDIATFGARKVLVVERFDRMPVTSATGSTWLARLPQEDICQSLGVSSAGKYESDGGPGIAAVLRLLDNSSSSRSDKLVFLKTLLAFWLMAATDGHAKNFSIFLERGGGYHLTPLYDVLSLWPIIGNGPNLLAWRRAKLAMAIRSKNTHYHLHEIQTRHWQALARQAGVPEAFDEMVGMVLQVPDALERVEAMLPPGFPQGVFRPIRRGMLEQAERFVEGLE